MKNIGSMNGEAGFFSHMAQQLAGAFAYSKVHTLHVDILKHTANIQGRFTIVHFKILDKIISVVRLYGPIIDNPAFFLEDYPMN